MFNTSSPFRIIVTSHSTLPLAQHNKVMCRTSYPSVMDGIKAEGGVGLNCLPVGVSGPSTHYPRPRRCA